MIIMLVCHKIWFKTYLWWQRLNLGQFYNKNGQKNVFNLRESIFFNLDDFENILSDMLIKNNIINGTIFVFIVIGN